MTSRPAWRKSKYSSSNGGACVELADLGETVGIRDSKDPHGPKLLITHNTLATLLAELKR
ncbi:DUF397 domain-containing protein [Actinomadura graeca]|uniref:DUF397 domain-containing protein n=1 Tax=Actinomadura graeca TaxID=2750812 RepID=A0ABX8QWE2_9ACTN|nr:DUF397 domain-containing protein [Actinomadura graeca]QXJ23090.1 DUF397 domain-containing protein [Actinomadura graeca]